MYMYIYTWYVHAHTSPECNLGVMARAAPQQKADSSSKTERERTAAINCLDTLGRLTCIIAVAAIKGSSVSPLLLQNEARENTGVWSPQISLDGLRSPMLCLCKQRASRAENRAFCVLLFPESLRFAVVTVRNWLCFIFIDKWILTLIFFFFLSTASSIISHRS